MQMQCSDICNYLNVPLQGTDAVFTSISTDSRDLQPGALFIAIKGANFDGHEYVSEALQRGATGVLVSKACDVASNVAVIQVADTLRAYGQIAAMHRAKFNIPMVAVTGSCGKTSVQSMIAAILRQVGNVLSPAGSFNNEIGLPRTLLQLTPQHQYAVLEMGARKPGDIKYLMEIVNPQVTLVNNVAPAHTETFGDVDTIAATKGEIYTCLQLNGTAIINVDDAYAPYWLSSLKNQQVITFGLEHSADITCAYIVEEHHRIKMELVTDIGTIQILLPLIGLHNVMNALAAAAAARALDVSLEDIKGGLESFVTVTRRMEIKAGKNGAKVIDDSYNANPVAMACAVDVLSKQAGTKIMVIGDMLELGPLSAERHKTLGQQAKAAGINKLLAFGKYAQHAAEEFGNDAAFYADKDRLIEDLTAMLNPGIVVLVKGSHGMRMNEVVNAII
ncbi:MAG TPA: UDP-N-acetylmuramoyl-tripeptide--D-alanyl-D-alanine ligase [Gammaproteobacteria bacterium]|nr:UDP-N-acetylmuramoyl-tripeptide--D-alanyl-D-alanine ligase [Gammaproteobacteria bacterium]